MKNEQASNSEFIKRLETKYKGIFLYTIKNIGNTLKPFDIMGVRNGRYIALEGKYMRQKSRPTADQVYKKLEPHQILSLYKVMKAGGSSCVVSYWEGNFYYYQMKDDATIEEVDKYSREQ